MTVAGLVGLVLCALFLSIFILYAVTMANPRGWCALWINNWYHRLFYTQGPREEEEEEDTELNDYDETPRKHLSSSSGPMPASDSLLSQNIISGAVGGMIGLRSSATSSGVLSHATAATPTTSTSTSTTSNPLLRPPSTSQNRPPPPLSRINRKSGPR